MQLTQAAPDWGFTLQVSNAFFPIGFVTKSCQRKNPLSK
jgi:hypothetical protein